MPVGLWSILTTVNLVIALGLAVLTVVMLRRRVVDRPVALAFLALQADLIVWTFGRLCSHVSEGLAESYFWFRVFFTGASLFGPAWLALALTWTRRANWLTPPRLALVALPGLALYASLLANESHRLFLTSIEHSGGVGGLVYSGGPLYWAGAVLIYVYIALGLILFIRSARISSGWLRRQSYLFVLASLVPLAVSVPVYLCGAGALVNLTLTMILAAELISAFFLYRPWFLDVVRLALAQAVEHMGDAIVVVDSQGRIRDVNPAFGKITGLYRFEVVGRMVDGLLDGLQGRIANLDQFLQLRAACRANPWRQVSGDIVLRGSPERIYELVVWPIQGPRDQLIGWVAALRDVTEARAMARRLVEANDRLRERTAEVAGALEEVRRLNDDLEARVAARTRELSAAVADLEALHETALAVASVHSLESTLSLILSAARRLTAADQACISILDRDGESFAVRADLDDSGEYKLTPTSRGLSVLARGILGDRRARFVEDVDREGAQRSPAMSERVRAYAGVPLASQDRLLGILYVAYNRPHRFTPANRRLIMTLASQAAVAIANTQMFEEISRAAITDSLTELPNHRHLMDRLDEEIERARQNGQPLAVIMIDVDDFKLVNDAHGHTVGDEAFRVIARVLRSTLQTGDVVGRYGGDEFLALLPNADREKAIRVAERMASAVRAQRFGVFLSNPKARPGTQKPTPHVGVHESDGIVIPLHLSVGVAIYPHDARSRLELVSLADAAMYASRQAGGDTTTLADTTDSGFLVAQNVTFGVLEGLLNAIDGKDHYTRAHSEQVARYALGLAEVLGLSDDTKRMLRIAGLLHDVGKIGIPDRILRKPGPLDDDERPMVEQHPLLGEMIVREVPVVPEVLGAVRHHHEHYDGTGYPRGLRGQAIPLLSRIIAVADAYSAMILDRPYRRALSSDRAIEELRKCAGTQLDPELVEAFVRSLDLDGSSVTLEPAATAL